MMAIPQVCVLCTIFGELPACSSLRTTVLWTVMILFLREELPHRPERRMLM